MEKIAIISDIHSNLEALNTVMKDIEQRNIQHIFCLGDIIAKGVHASQCIKIIKEKCEVVLQGNCDEYFSKEYLEEEKNERIRFNQNLTTKEEREYLKKLPFSYDFYMSGTHIRLFHATPTNNHTFIGASSSMEEEWQMFLDEKKGIADVVIYGHTHTPYLNKAYHHTLINCGSVGNNMEIFQDENHPGNIEETCKACYLIVEGNYEDHQDGPISYTYVKLPYDKKKELVNDIDNPEKDVYEKEILEGKYRDIQKIKNLIKYK